MPFDAYLTPVARRFMNSLTREEQKDCNDTIMNQLCYIASIDDAKNFPSAFPYGQGIVQRVVGNWTFTYKIANAATIESVLSTMLRGIQNTRHWGNSAPSC